MIPEPTLNDTIGAALLGGFATSMLYGVVCSQCYTFFQHSKLGLKPPLVKYTIAILWVLMTLYTALVLQPLYWYAVSNFGDVSKVLDVTWSIRACVILAAINDALVRSSFVHRSWHLGKRQPYQGWFTYPLTFMVVCLFCVTMTVGVWTFRLNSLQDFQSIKVLYFTNLVMVVIVDVTIAGRLTFQLAHGRQKEFKKTYTLANTLMAYTINTGLITSLVSTACFVAYATMPNNYVFVAVFFPLSPLYVNALLASYNAKSWLRNDDGICARYRDVSLNVHVMRTQETCPDPRPSGSSEQG